MAAVLGRLFLGHDGSAVRLPRESPSLRDGRHGVLESKDKVFVPQHHGAIGRPDVLVKIGADGLLPNLERILVNPALKLNRSEELACILGSEVLNLQLPGFVLAYPHWLKLVERRRGFCSSPAQRLHPVTRIPHEAHCEYVLRQFHLSEYAMFPQAGEVAAMQVDMFHCGKEPLKLLGERVRAATVGTHDADFPEGPCGRQMLIPTTSPWPEDHAGE
mmetsp:Transcript_47069/g.108767  ORF Transcript_47069/g.108767 Transcript_47069/m.108767 type:complete len:217 (-) Transcript_47069:521-1171(-)